MTKYLFSLLAVAHSLNLNISDKNIDINSQQVKIQKNNYMPYPVLYGESDRVTCKEEKSLEKAYKYMYKNQKNLVWRNISHQEETDDRTYLIQCQNCFCKVKPKEGGFVIDRVYFYTDFLNEICKKYPLSFPEKIEFYHYCWDRCPYENTPIFCTDGIKGKYNIITVPRSFVDPKEINRTKLLLNESIIPLNSKIPKAIFFGQNSNHHREDLAKLVRKNPNFLVRIKIKRILKNYIWFLSKYFFDHEMSLIYSFDYMGDDLQKNYKYVIVLDGISLPDRFPRQLSYGSVILKQESEFYEFWWDDLIPNKDYIAFKNPAQLIEMINYFESPQGKSNTTLQSWLQEIAKNGRRKMEQTANIFTEERMACYAINMLQNYQLFLKTKV